MASLTERIDQLSSGFEKTMETANEETRLKLNRLLIERLYAMLDENDLSPEDRDYARTYYESLGIATVTIRTEDLKAFKEMQVKTRPDWEAVFNVDTNGSTYPFVRWGRTPEQERLYSQGLKDTLNRIAEIAIQARGKAGRVFINQKGVYYKDQTGLPHRFIRFEFPQQ